MPKLVTHQFTMDTENVYTVNNGVLTKEVRREPVQHYARTGPNVGYLDPEEDKALRIRDNDICRIDHDAFMELRKYGMVSPADMRGVIRITYDTNTFTDMILGVNTHYKDMDKNELDFGEVELKRGDATKNDEGNVPDEVQHMAEGFMGRRITENEIRVYQSIINSAIHRQGKFDADNLTVDEQYEFEKLQDEGTVLSGSVGDDIIVSIPDNNKMHFMQRACDMYTASLVTRGGRRPEATYVASSAMNLTQQQRERIGLVNQGVQRNHEDESGQHRRFGSGGSITVGSIHRPTTAPITKPVIQEDTSAFYSAMVMKCKFTKYEKPIGVKSKVCIDKRFPMYAVPMIIDEMMGYAYLKSMGQNTVATDYIPVSTPVEGTYWMFHNMENGKGITYYPDVLADVVSNNTNLFPDIDLTGKIRIAINNFGNLFTDDVDEEKKLSIMSIYSEFFKSNPNFFHIMKIDWNTGFVVALSEESTPVLLMAAMIDEGYIEYPKYMTVIPISGSVGFAAVGLNASEVGHIENALGLLGAPLE